MDIANSALPFSSPSALLTNVEERRRSLSEFAINCKIGAAL